MRMKVALAAVLVTLGLGMSAAMGQAPAAPDPALQAMFPEEIRKAGVLRIGLSAPQPPFVIQDQPGSQDYQGVDPELARTLGERAGLKVEFRNYAFSGLLAALQAKQVDALWTGLLPSKDRLAVANFVVYFRNPFGIVVRKGNPLGITGVGDLCGRNVARVEGSTPPALIIEERQPLCAAKGLPPIKVTVYPNTVTCQLAIMSGAADAMVGAAAAAAYIAKTVNNGAAFDHVVDKQGLGGTVYFADGVATLTSNKPLQDAIQRGLQNMMDDGSYLKILEKHGQQEFAVKTATINVLE